MYQVFNEKGEMVFEGGWSDAHFWAHLEREAGKECEVREAGGGILKTAETEFCWSVVIIDRIPTILKDEDVKKYSKTEILETGMRLDSAKCYTGD